MPTAYENAGVSVEAGYEVVNRIQRHVARTARQGAGGIGGFGGLFDLSSLNYQQPVLVSGTDGVGTKLLVAKAAGRHDTIGMDCVAMCVNDILAQGAEPIFFLDYIACGKNDPELLEQVVKGVTDGCVEAGAALVGGETAEMPDMYDADEYDLAGFTVGVVEKSKIIDGSAIQEGDVIIGLPSSGVHSNGFSLVRKALFKDSDFTVDTKLPELEGLTLADELLKPTRIYAKALKPLFAADVLNGVAHITGGGFVEKVPRIIPEGLAAAFDIDSWDVPPIFRILQEYGHVEALEMYNIFNMGIGMVLMVSPAKAAEVGRILDEANEAHYVVGRIIKDNGARVELRHGI
ncbi:phosphoribosylformylglycinamidine cyclo-ligase [Bifidobacterium sp.]|jgi:phosphoribosylformylglycinamidine cyclo-ligase|uniref:phosphoribosylformylglycinamidine cyclo-ligase n=1 Tax=Bifidobacterium sp. TaxID=41200 RepID=UPI0025B87C6C|nr:phosphoribosylformylglycinamidine cyclo-ligase [Bifidobacterium sp.]MCH4159936.1 phosphoribosylformylglycinamidine cyclo-ligase [Bifidobacterium sp.]MCH4175133.1 phosphoribosylformylglycinamidine cyclo-ligase [Bifidobacterium sp.]MCI1635484.1 phosphoribosylformylglycinamidine cyclo-ligase [Bifidobacterium sp.]